MPAPFSGTCRTVLHLLGLCCCLLLSRPAAGQAVPFSSLVNTLNATQYGTFAFGDLDQDGQQDLYLTGALANAGFASMLRFNAIIEVPLGQSTTSALSFVDAGPAGLQPLYYAAAAFGDYDNDGDLDLLATGATRLSPPFEPAAILYRNDGNLRMVPAGAGLVGLYGASAAWGDYDNDGDLDLLLTGARSASDAHYATYLYRNDEGSFTDTHMPLAGKAFGTGRWADYDNDGDLDLLLTGAAGPDDARYTPRLYRNDGGTFSEVDHSLAGLVGGAARWGDYDADGDLDLLLTGGRPSPGVLLQGTTHLYRNDGGTFVDAGAGLRGAAYGGTAWGDYDGDGDLDLLLTGLARQFDAPTLDVYLNEGAGGFRHALTRPAFRLATAAALDLEADGDLDLMTSGVGLGNTPLFLFNETRLRNTPPAAPAQPTQQVDGTAVTLAWAPAADGETPAAGLTYNLRVGTTPGGVDVVSPMAMLGTGQRLVSAMGNVQQNTRWTLRGLPAGTYYWSVQALDSAYQGSPFSAEQSFVLP